MYPSDKKEQHYKIVDHFRGFVYSLECTQSREVEEGDKKRVKQERGVVSRGGGGRNEFEIFQFDLSFKSESCH